MTHPIHKYRAIAAKWDEILSENDGGKLRRPITAEECCRMILATNGILCFNDMNLVRLDFVEIRKHVEKASNGV